MKSSTDIELSKDVSATLSCKDDEVTIQMYNRRIKNGQLVVLKRTVAEAFGMRLVEVGHTGRC